MREEGKDRGFLFQTHNAGLPFPVLSVEEKDDVIMLKTHDLLDIVALTFVEKNLLVFRERVVYVKANHLITLLTLLLS